MSQTINNLEYFCYKIFFKPNSKELKDCNKTKFANYSEIDLTTLSKWLNYQNPNRTAGSPAHRIPETKRYIQRQKARR